MRLTQHVSSLFVVVFVSMLVIFSISSGPQTCAVSLNGALPFIRRLVASLKEEEIFKKMQFYVMHCPVHKL